MANEAVGVVAKEATRNMLRMQMKTHTYTHTKAQQIAAQTRLDISMWMQSSQEPRPFKLSGIVRALKTTLRLRSNLFHLDSFRSPSLFSSSFFLFVPHTVCVLLSLHKHKKGNSPHIVTASH